MALWAACSICSPQIYSWRLHDSISRHLLLSNKHLTSPSFVFAFLTSCWRGSLLRLKKSTYVRCTMLEYRREEWWWLHWTRQYPQSWWRSSKLSFPSDVKRLRARLIFWRLAIGVSLHPAHHFLRHLSRLDSILVPHHLGFLHLWPILLTWTCRAPTQMIGSRRNRPSLWIHSSPAQLW